MFTIKEDAGRTILMLVLFLLAALMVYELGITEGKSQNHVYYDMGLEDGYHEGMDQCGEAAWRKVDGNGTEWMKYEPHTILDRWTQYPV